MGAMEKSSVETFEGYGVRDSEKEIKESEGELTRRWKKKKEPTKSELCE